VATAPEPRAQRPAAEEGSLPSRVRGRVALRHHRLRAGLQSRRPLISGLQVLIFGVVVGCGSAPGETSHGPVPQASASQRSTERAPSTPLPDFVLTATVRGDIVEDYHGKQAVCGRVNDGTGRLFVSADDFRASGQVLVEVYGFKGPGTFSVSAAGPGVVAFGTTALDDTLRAQSGSVAVAGGGGAYSGSFEGRFASRGPTGVVTVEGSFVCANAAGL